MCSNKLSALPDFSVLKFLQSLQLKYNFFTALPQSLLGLPRLEVLELAGNQLASLDERILAALPKLRCAQAGLHPQRTVLRPTATFPICC